MKTRPNPGPWCGMGPLGSLSSHAGALGLPGAMGMGVGWVCAVCGVGGVAGAPPRGHRVLCGHNRRHHFPT